MDTSLEQILEVYTLEEILELNDLTPVEALEILIRTFGLELPETLPL